MAAAVFFATAALLDPRMPFTLSQGFVTNDIVRAGDEVKVDWTQTWSRRCRAESVRSIVRSDKKVDVYDKAFIAPPQNTGMVQSIATAKLSSIMPPGPAIYRATVTFPAQLSMGCVMVWPMTFTTPDVQFTVSR